ncbi:MAG: SHOCT domain-containing protein [Chloroflexi bacterium]|nr:SHOCT domain-containing protein [Chloroflexota bacterium]
MPEAMMQARGVYRDLELLPDMVRIRRRGTLGFLTPGTRVEKDILISKIVSIRFKKAGILADGYIQFIFEEKGPKDKSAESEVGDDENVVVFRSRQQPAFEAIREAIEQKMTGSRSGPRQASNFDELVRLSELLNRKIITEDEFNRKKKQILGL